MPDTQRISSKYLLLNWIKEDNHGSSIIINLVVKLFSYKKSKVTLKPAWKIYYEFLFEFKSIKGFNIYPFTYPITYLLI